ncbi:P2X purinoceptor 3 [Fukomys damarensis]|uniref:p2X purinoceptor 3 n=1 Tax=Fukomys damarensis TaxID=885580 RepID=A0A091CTI7_FUKDA|nr:P2X purinoceptor 3 [Fukomys damarensis]
MASQRVTFTVGLEDRDMVGVGTAEMVAKGSGQPGACPSCAPGILTGRCVNLSSQQRSCEVRGWCPTEVDTVERPVMMEAENFTIFIKNSIRFPLFNFEKGNLPPELTASDMKTCRFHPDRAPFCPILRVGDVVSFAGQDFAKLASTGGVLGIKIGWVCDLDRAEDQCVPRYSFTRLDSVSEKSRVSPGYNFSSFQQESKDCLAQSSRRFAQELTCGRRFAKYYKTENGSEYRTLMKAFGIRFDVLVYGNGTVLCDIILLNFLKGADQYKAKKFERVNESTLKGANPACPLDQATEEKQSTDSGAYSIGH